MPSAPSLDLQSHSTHSDGDLAPAAVVAAAAAAGVQRLALSDHDTVDGVDEALRAARDHGIEVIPAVELSIVDDAAPDLHVLGYRIDHRSPELSAALERFRDDRVGRADRMAAKLEDAGLAIDHAALARRRAEGLTIGRPHLAQAALDAAANGTRLEREGISSVTDFIRAYLIEGKPGFAGRETPRAQEAIDVIHAAGGVAVWAHPFWDIGEDDAVIATLDRFTALGLDGVEAFYVTHDADQTRLLVAAAAERNLLTTASSDFHGPEHRLFSRFRAFDTYGLEPRLGPIAEAAA